MKNHLVCGQTHQESLPWLRHRCPWSSEHLLLYLIKWGGNNHLASWLQRWERIFTACQVQKLAGSGAQWAPSLISSQIHTVGNIRVGSEPGFPKVSPKWPWRSPLFPPVLLCVSAKQPPVHHKEALVRFPRPDCKPLLNALPAHFIKVGIKS